MFRLFRYGSAAAFMILAGWIAQPAYAETPEEILASIRKEAEGAPQFQPFSVERGADFFRTRHASEWSCASCHTDHPASPGKHAKTGKIIEPLAPSGNQARFTNPKKVEKWFRRNCNDVLDRACTTQEKGDVLAYLLTVKQ